MHWHVGARATFYFHFSKSYYKGVTIRATSHTRLNARDHYTSTGTPIGGKDGAGPSSLHTTLEGPKE